MTWTHLSDTRHTARKRHVCELCGELIAIGSRYVRRVGTIDGEISSVAMHEACEAVTHSWAIDDWETHSRGDGYWPIHDEGGIMQWMTAEVTPTPGRWVMLRWSRDTQDGMCPGYWSAKTRGYQRTAEGEQRGNPCHPTHWRELTTEERIAFNKPMTCDACDREMFTETSRVSCSRCGRLGCSGCVDVFGDGLCEFCDESDQKIRNHEEDDYRGEE